MNIVKSIDMKTSFYKTHSQTNTYSKKEREGERGGGGGERKERVSYKSTGYPITAYKYNNMLPVGVDMNTRGPTHTHKSS